MTTGIVGNRFVRGLFAAVVALTCLAGASSADSSSVTPKADPNMEQQIAHQLSVTPGAKRVSPTEVAWKDGNVDVVVSYAAPGNAASGTPDCPSLWVCVYHDENFGYPRQAFTKCGTSTILSAIAVSSWHNNQTNETVSKLYDAAGQVLQSSRAVSKVDFVGVGSNDLARTILVC
jgi:hypothetical protein